MKLLQAIGFAGVAALLSLQPAGAAEPSPLGRDAISFMIDFCGSVLGPGPVKLEVAAKDLHAATLFPAEPISDTSPRYRDAIVNALHVSNDTPVHRVTFKQSTAQALAFGFVRTDLASCMVQFVGPAGAANHLVERFQEPGAGWRELYGTDDSRAWQKTRNDGRVLTVSALGSEKAYTITIDATLPQFPTISEFDAFADSVREPCVRAVLGDSKPDAGPFDQYFDVRRTNPDGSVLLWSKHDIPGGRLMLIPTARGSACMFAVEKQDASIPYRRAFAASFMRLPGAEHIQPPDEVWLYTDPVSKRGVAMFIEMRQGALVITLEHDPPLDTPRKP